ncbi:hypothetical protein [Aquimarina sp. I32.4]|uniref:DUF3885 domain-containing protein n=1 Tax=Aquimarina sp. I32.4 TaxID=2053903 RepID=UPI000CDEB2DC|nr:hypothetical protein [Aquimarina sp. I32.4]
MNCEEFTKYWRTTYAEANPIWHELKGIYSNRWIRVHNLPESKRYAETEDEYQIILNRQNKLISELVEENSEIMIVTGQYEKELTTGISNELSGFGEFKKCRTLELHKIYPEQYDVDFFYDIYFRSDIWKRNSKNDLLKSIADDEFQAMFISPKGGCILIPYYGGMDIIVDSKEKRDGLKIKYSDWLSKREDGL